MAIEIPNNLHASAGVTPIGFSFNQGFSAFLVNGVGDFSLTLDQELEQLAGTYRWGMVGGAATGAIVVIERPDDATVRCRVFNVAGALDAVFELAVYSFAEGN